MPESIPATLIIDTLKDTFREARAALAVEVAEPLLDTFGVPHARLEGPDDVHLIPEYYRLSRSRKGPAVVLVGLETI